MEEARDLDACLESRLDARETPLELELNKLRQFLEEQFSTQLQLLQELKRAHSPGPTRTTRVAAPVGPAAGDMSVALASDTGEVLLDPGLGEFEPGPGSMASDCMSVGTDCGEWRELKNGEFREHKMKALEAQRKMLSPVLSREFTDTEAPAALQLKDVPSLIVNSPYFPLVIQIVIVVNLLILGVEVDITAALPLGQVPTWFQVVNYLIVTVFALELLLKFMAFGCREFFCSSDRAWNVFDLIIVLISLLETGVEVVAKAAASDGADMNTSHLRAMRLARLVRTLRGVRVIRLLRYISSLRTIMISIVSTMGSLFWTLVLLVLVFYTFAVILTQLVSDYCKYDLQADTLASCNYHDVAYWSSVPESMLTLFLSISGGLSWIDALLPLRQIGPIAVGSMLLYIVLTIFAILNVVTGVFCNNAIESAKTDKDIAIMKQMYKHESQVRALREIFAEIDMDSSEKITISELKEALTAEKMRSFLQSMDISTEDVWTLFMVIDSNGDGVISADEFVLACQQLQGPAKGLQMARMSFENTVMREEVKKLQKDFVRFNKKIESGASPTRTPPHSPNPKLEPRGAARLSQRL
ncbi:unnamed protein product [Effrenium voratum]|uniref:EF-hand domain-containing protein n=1 Tax=Effrenium voratum TaxID=2562239 RepID=A0AA36JFE2_9DINO|nr:unnamed protein product [Effrenium voratum]CAJ1404622.1 unnamed protein product [Effrenium voratum]